MSNWEAVDLRAELIAAGLIKLPVAGDQQHVSRGLRLDHRGRLAALEHIREGRHGAIEMPIPLRIDERERFINSRTNTPVRAVKAA